VHLVNEQDDLAFGRQHLLQHGLEPFLEFAAIFWPPAIKEPMSSATTFLSLRLSAHRP